MRELNNIPCLELLEEPDAKQGIGTAKIFMLSDYSLIAGSLVIMLAEVDLFTSNNKVLQP
jgi:DNA polymerase V